MSVCESWLLFYEWLKHIKCHTNGLRTSTDAVNKNALKITQSAQGYIVGFLWTKDTGMKEAS